MLIGAEIRLDVGFNAAQAKLANLARGGLLGRASGGAYDEWQAGLARVGPQGTMLGMSRLARVRIRDMVTHGDSAFWAMRWEVADRHGVLVPALDADIKLTPAGKTPPFSQCPPSAGRRLPVWSPDWTRRSCTRSPRQRCRPSPTTSRQISPTRPPRLMQDTGVDLQRDRNAR